MSFQGLFWGALLGLLLTGTSAEVDPTEEVGVLGESATFKLDYPESSDSVLWSRNGVHMATLRRGPPCTLIPLKAYKGRIVTHSEDCDSLTVGHLREEDAAKYTAQFQNEATSELSGTQTSITLKVFKRLSEADLEIHCKEESHKDGNKTLHLNCSAGKWGDGVGFSWTSPGQEDPTVSSSEVTLFLPLNTHNDDQNLTCMAQNPVSNASRTVSLKTCAAGKQSTTRPSTVADTETAPPPLSSLPSVVIPVVLVSILLVVVAVVVWRVKRNKAADREHIPPSNNSESKDCRSLYVEIGRPQISDLGSGSPEEGRGSGAPKETPTTIYADVQHPEKTLLQTDDEKIRREKRRAAEKSEKTIYSEISGCEVKEAKQDHLKTIYDTVNFPKPPETSEYNKIL